jgi:hypothetical protein
MTWISKIFITFVYIKKVEIMSFVKNRIRIQLPTFGSGSEQKDPDPVGYEFATMACNTV